MNQNVTPAVGALPYIPAASPLSPTQSVLSLPVANAVSNSGGGGGRSPGLIFIVAAFALIMISLQSMSELSELLLQHVDDSLLEDGTLFSAMDVVEHELDGIESLEQVNDYDEDDEINEASISSPQPSIPQAINKEKADFPALNPRKDRGEKIMVNIAFKYFRDHYGLLTPEFNQRQLQAILSDTRDTWLKANILLNFTFPASPIPVDDMRADAYRWFVYGSKDQNKQRFWKDVRVFLRQGKSKMRTAQERDILTKYYQFWGHPLMDWITHDETHSTRDTLFEVVSVRYWPWNNGGQLGNKLFFRGGTCNNSTQQSAASQRLRKDEYILCDGWNSAAGKQAVMSVQEASRILSHLIGHFFGLKHPSPYKCTVLNKNSPLMCQPRKQITDLSFFMSRGMDEEEKLRAREGVRSLVSKKLQII